MASAAQVVDTEGLTDGQVLRAMVANGELTILDVMDAHPWFKGQELGPAAPWTSWRAFIAACYGLPMTAEELRIFRQCTGRQNPPKAKAKEAWLIVGRRGRKSAIAALIGVWEGVLRDHTSALAPGERALIPIIAKNKAEAETIRSFITALMTSRNLREFLQKRVTGDTIELSTNVDIEVKAVSLTAGRSRCVPAALLDEIAFFKSEDSVHPDKDVVDGIRPAMATVENGILVALSSPYDKRGLLWETYSSHFGKEDDPILVWQADTLTMHDSPRIREHVADAYKQDDVAAEAEYGAKFRTDIGPYVRPESVDKAIMVGVEQVPFDPAKPKACYAFADPSEGSQDSFSLAIADNGLGSKGPSVRVVYIREWKPPFNPDEVADQISEVMKSYRLTQLEGDRVGGVWLRDLLSKRGISYFLASLTKNQIYREVLPRFNTNSVLLVDNFVLHKQLKRLERKLSRSGDIIDHPPGEHDDLANSACGAIYRAGLSQYDDPKPEQPYADNTYELVRRARAEALEKERHPYSPRPHASPGRLGAYRRKRHI